MTQWVKTTRALPEYVHLNSGTLIQVTGSIGNYQLAVDGPNTAVVLSVPGSPWADSGDAEDALLSLIEAAENISIEFPTYVSTPE